MKRKKKEVLLLGEGVHQHTLYGDFLIDEVRDDYSCLTVKKDSLLKHEHPSGKFGEHKTLEVESGDWIMGKQVEYNPFTQKVTRVWD